MEAEIPCPNCERLEKVVKDLQGQLDLLKQQLEEVKAELRKSKRQMHRFSKEKPNPYPKKPGRRKGEGPFEYRNPPEKVDHSIPAPALDVCPDCQEPLTQKRQHRHWQTDIPPIQPEVTEFQTESGWCSKCKKRSRSQAPGQLVTATGAAAHGIGPHLAALAAKLKHENGMPYRQMADLFEVLFGIKVTPSALVQGSQRLAAKCQLAHLEIQTQVKQTGVIHSDGTGWKIGTKNACLWTFTNPDLTLYRIDRRFGHGVVIDVLGADYAGVLVSDRHGSYGHHRLKDWKKQKCNLHIIRNLKELLKGKKRGAVNFGRDLIYLIRAAMDLARRREDVPDFSTQAKTLKDSLTRMLSPTRKWSDPDNAKLAAALHKDLPHLFRYLDDPRVEATNNRAERDLRPAVVVRKIGRCNKTDAGADTHAAISSILGTLRKKGFNPLCGLIDLLSMPVPSFGILSLPP